MPKICGRCGRPKSTERKKDRTRQRASAHQCELAQVVKVSTRDSDHPYIKQVHVSAIEPGGYLYEKTRGKKAEWEVIFRPVSKLSEKKPTRKREGKKVTKKEKAVASE